MLLLLFTAFGILCLYLDARIIQDFHQESHAEKESGAQRSSRESQHDAPVSSVRGQDRQITRALLLPIVAKVDSRPDQKN